MKIGSWKWTLCNEESFKTNRNFLAVKLTELLGFEIQMLKKYIFKKWQKTNKKYAPQSERVGVLIKVVYNKYLEN